MEKTIEFIGINGKRYKFRSEKNSLNNNQMSWIEPLHTMYVGIGVAKQMIADIRKNCTVLNEY